MAMGGVGEAALLGAVMGGGSAMLTGGDPLKGALMGGLTGGIGGAAGPALSSLTTPTAAATLAPAVTEAAVANAAINPYTTASTAFNSAATTLPNAVNAAINPAVTSSVPGVVSSGINALPNGLPPDIAESILGKIAPGSVVPSTAVAPSAAPTVAQNAPILNSKDIGNFAAPNYSLAKNPVAPVVDAAAPAAPAAPKTFMEGMAKFAKDPMASLMDNKFTAAGSALAGANAGKKKKEEEEEYAGPLSRFKYNPDKYRPSGYADGGITSLGYGGYDQMVGEEPMYVSDMAAGGIADLGSYSDGGRMLKGPGDGMSDSIPAMIGKKQPARLADGEFVIPADVVSHLGNGSTDAGAKQLYAMMNKVRQARTGRKAQGREINPRQYVPA